MRRLIHLDLKVKPFFFTFTLSPLNTQELESELEVNNWFWQIFTVQPAPSTTNRDECWRVQRGYGFRRDMDNFDGKDKASGRDNSSILIINRLILIKGIAIIEVQLHYP